MSVINVRNEKLANEMIKSLQERHFNAYFCKSKEEALEKALEIIPENSSVTWGGSVTINEIGLTKALHEGNYKVYDRASVKPEDKDAFMKESYFSDWFLSSANAITEDGVIVNIDGTGNRVSAITFGPKNVLIIVGMNKVAKNVEDAVSRARNVAAPINAQRFNGKSPCVLTGKCMNCKSPDCICSAVVITRTSRPAGKINVILVDDNLGF